MVVKPLTSSHSKYKSILLISRRCTAPFYHTFKMIYILLHFHSLNKYLLSTYSVHVLDPDHIEQDSYRPYPLRAHTLTEKADSQLIIHLLNKIVVTNREHKC